MERSRAISAGLWSTIDFGLRFGVQFGVSIVLARLLDPVDFGIYAMTAIFMGLSSILVDGGFSTALIQRKQVSRETETAVFHYNVIAAAVLALVIVAIAPIVASFYGYPVLRPLLYVSAATLFVGSFGAVPGALLSRKLQFAKIAKIGLSSSLVSAAVGVTAALLGAGVWTFPLQAGTGTLCSVAGLWATSDWRPFGRIRLRAARSLAGFGSLLTVSGLLEIAYLNGYPLIIGRLYGANDVGFFNRGQNLQALPSNVISGVVQRVLLPTLSRQADDKVASTRSVKTAVAAAMFVNLPLMGFLGLFPELVITVLYGPKWLPAAPVLKILALAGAIYPFHVINLQVLLAQGRADMFLKVEVAKKLIGVACVIVGSLFGVIGLAIGHVVFTIIAFFMNTGASAKLIGYSAWPQLRDASGIAILALAATSLAKASQPLLEFGNAINLLLLAMITGVIFLSATALFRVGIAGELIDMARSHIGRKRSSRAAPLPTEPIHKSSGFNEAGTVDQPLGLSALITPPNN